MENLFTTTASNEALVRQKQNAFLSKLLGDLRSAYTNILHFINSHYENCSIWRIGIHPNSGCVHEFTIKKDGSISYSSHSTLVFESDKKKYAKISSLMEKYPKSVMYSSGFSLRIEGITEDNIKDYISDIVYMLETDGFTLKF